MPGPRWATYPVLCLVVGPLAVPTRPIKIAAKLERSRTDRPALGILLGRGLITADTLQAEQVVHQLEAKSLERAPPNSAEVPPERHMTQAGKS